ncbi:metallophosphoesterase [Paenibacillus hodogayensis]|uniref:Metallophosphoesterase n=1 Tax=Paenibacillus hodogayensis TaxID=279208 RepID=A0ABV5VY86_9BACL
MLIAFVGDTHGRVLHTLAVLSEWQIRTKKKLDLIIQVGDLGAYPEPSEEVRSEKYVRQDPAELDFSRFLTAEGRLEKNIRYIREKYLNRIYFIRGNHEDFDWLNSKSLQAEQGIVNIDPFDLYYYVTDGTIMNEDNLKIAFLGGIQTLTQQPKSIDPVAYGKLIQMPPREIDILITHDAPFGIGTNYHGQTQGSTLISDLIGAIQPKYVIAGHYHHMNGPRTFGSTTYLGLNVLVDLRDDGELRRVRPGSIALLDTEMNSVNFITDDWLSSIDKDFNFITHMEELIKRDN